MTVEEFLQHAEECERLAAAAKLPANQHSLLSPAEMWRKMAADVRPRDGAGKNPVLGDPMWLPKQVREVDPASSGDTQALGRRARRQR